MNQMLQETELKEPEPKTPETPDAPPPPTHPRFAKPQRVAFVQSSWHREVVDEARIAFLDEIEARGIERARVDLFEVPAHSRSRCMRNCWPRHVAIPRS